LRIRVRGAWSADGRWVSPAAWTVEEGRTVSLERADEADVDGVLLPGFVNVHAHLDLSGHPPLPSRGRFTDWLLGVGGVRAQAGTVAERSEGASREMAARGVVAAGDIDGSGGDAVRGRRASGLVGRTFLEIVGVSVERARQRLADALALVDRLGGGGGDLGLSPHAPYSVHGSVLSEVARAAGRRGLPLAMHLAESVEERRFLMEGDGAFKDFLQVIGQGLPFDRPPAVSPIAYTEQTGLLQAGCLVVHGNDVDDEDLVILARHGCSVVYCHGTHRHFERPPHRMLDMLNAGINVALGTDSSLSNERVDLLGELRRLAADRPDISPDTVLRCATTGGRVALQMETGPAAFTPGSIADGVVLGPAPATAESMTRQDAVEWVLRGESDVLLTVHAGVVIEGSETTSAFLDTPMGQG
jgi:cytosine/adenosine deaminase-related metal-dependent hydrolase